MSLKMSKYGKSKSLEELKTKWRMTRFRCKPHSLYCLRYTGWDPEQEPRLIELDRSQITTPTNENAGMTTDYYAQEPAESSTPLPATTGFDLYSMISFEEPVSNHLIRQPPPPHVLAEVHDLENPLPSLRAEAPLELHIAPQMMEAFMHHAYSNTQRDLETCGILAGKLENNKFYITTLIIPKQVSTSISCQATNEEEIHREQSNYSLQTLGWIHTHPTQACFMSSVDVHTHHAYQIMSPEAIAVVMAPQDSARKHGIFRLTTPGMMVIRNCNQHGLHEHSSPADGGPIYKTCADVYMNPNLNFGVIDLREHR